MKCWRMVLILNSCCCSICSHLNALDAPKKLLRSCNAAFAFSTLCFNCSNVDWWKRYVDQSGEHWPSVRQSSVFTCANVGGETRFRSSAVWYEQEFSYMTVSYVCSCGICRAYWQCCCELSACSSCCRCGEYWVGGGTPAVHLSLTNKGK